MQSDHTFYRYDREHFYDELFDESGAPRVGARVLINRINSLPPGELKQRQTAIDRALLRMGITFTVYGNEQGTEKIFPFDIVPASSKPKSGSRSRRTETTHRSSQSLH